MHFNLIIEVGRENIYLLMFKGWKMLTLFSVACGILIIDIYFEFNHTSQAKLSGNFSYYFSLTLLRFFKEGFLVQNKMFKYHCHSPSPQITLTCKNHLLLQMHPSFNVSGYLEIYHYYICPGFIITWSICISNYFSLDMITDIFPIWFFFVILISFDALELLFSVSTSVNRKGLLMRPLQVSQHTDILQTQRRFYLFCYSTKFQHLHSTSYFQELTQNTHKKAPINLQT